LKSILVTGATGYIGGRLIPALIEKGFQVRCLVRDGRKISDRSWFRKVEIICGDVFETASMTKALEGIDVAYYLIHSMSAGKDFHQQDLKAAGNFSDAAEKAGVKQMIYLGALGNPDSDLSDHLRSRQETGDKLRSSAVPVTEFRAAVIVGAGSLSFEMIRYLTERVPVMICPSWVYTRTQPIAVDDVIAYLLSAAGKKTCFNRIIEIGGDEVITYREMMLGYARERGLKRLMIPVPVLTPRLSSYWVHLVTPVASVIARPLIEGLKNEVIVRNNLAQQLFPGIKPKSYREAVHGALLQLQPEVFLRYHGTNTTRLSDRSKLSDTTVEEGMICERHQRIVAASPAQLYETFISLGGEQGWLSMNWAWRLRGWFDWLVGGVGMRRGRPGGNKLRAGDTIDFWRVETVEAGQLLRLKAEMKVPGAAWLQFEAEPDDGKKSRLIQTAYFAPLGLAGLFYWYLLYPVHKLIFNRLISKIAAKSV